jgi:hypothetical protein
MLRQALATSILVQERRMSRPVLLLRRQDWASQARLLARLRLQARRQRKRLQARRQRKRLPVRLQQRLQLWARVRQKKSRKGVVVVVLMSPLSSSLSPLSLALLLQSMR